jgi:hypothetical protein
MSSHFSFSSVSIHVPPSACEAIRRNFGRRFPRGARDPKRPAPEELSPRGVSIALESDRLPAGWMIYSTCGCAWRAPWPGYTPVCKELCELHAQELLEDW